MKSYIVVTGAVFAAVVGLHLVRLAVEGAQVLRDPFDHLAQADFRAIQLTAMILQQHNFSVQLGNLSGSMVR